MKCVIPEISYHNRDPVLSLDFQLSRKPGDPVRLATAGSDTHVVIFSVTTDKEGKVELDCLSDLTRHQKAVNIVRWSPDGSLLASGDDESVIILWQLKQNTSDAPSLFDEDGVENKENWVVYKMIRSHLDDVYDLSWSPCSQFLLSGSVDNTAIITNVHKNQKVGHFSDSHGFVQGVAWNPKHSILATISSDRKCRFYNTVTRKLIGKTYKAFLNLEMDKIVKKKKSKDKTNKPSTNKAESDERSEVKKDAEVQEGNDSEQTEGSEPTKETKAESQEETKDEKTEKNVRLFHDDTFKGFFRRLQWSLDGEILVVPSGVLETDTDAQLTHCTHVFSRIELNKPAICLPSRDKYTIAVRFCPISFKLRPVKRKGAPAKTDGLEPWEIYQTLFALPYRFVYAVATQNAVMIYDTQQASPIARVSNIHYTGLTDLSWSPDGQVLIVSSSDGFCSIITFSNGELGEVYVPETPLDTPVDTPAATPDRKKKEEEGFNEHGVKSPAQIHIKSSKEGGKSNPKRLKFITLSSPKADKRRPLNLAAVGEQPARLEVGNDDAARDGIDGDDAMEGIEVMDNGDLNLELEDTQQTKTEPPKPEKKRVPLISIPTGPNTISSKPEGDAAPEERKGKRVELITLSSPKPKQKN